MPQQMYLQCYPMADTNEQEVSAFISAAIYQVGRHFVVCVSFFAERHRLKDFRLPTNAGYAIATFLGVAIGVGTLKGMAVGV